MGKFSSLEQFLNLFPEKRIKTRDGYNVICPAHNDRTPSLSVSLNDNKILLDCKAGCPTPSVLEALKLTGADLFLNNGTHGTAEVEYVYRNLDGTPRFVIKRYYGKKFLAFLPNAQRAGIGDTPHILYHAPAVINAVKGKKPVWVVEGEKDADYLRSIAGFCTTTPPFGCEAKWEQSYTDMLKGGDVVIIPDTDPPGLEKGRAIAEALSGEASSVKLLALPKGKDVSEYLANGKGSLEELVNIYNDTPEYSPFNVNTSTYTKYIAVTDPVLASKRDNSVTDSVTSETKLRDRIIELLKSSTGWVSYGDIDRELGLDANDRVNRRQIIKREKKGVIEHHPTNDKLIRFINTEVRKIDFKRVGKRTPLDIKFPFGIEKFCNIYSKNLIVVSGSPNSGKTGLLLNFIRLNMRNFPIFYQSSEMGDVELAERLSLFPDINIQDWNFEAEERMKDLADVTRPDAVNIYDYMVLTENVYLVADKLDAIQAKLGTGIGIIAIQKKLGAKLGRGQEYGLERPRLYLSLDKPIGAQEAKIEIIKAKNWKDPEVNPDGYKLNFSITHGCRFTADAMGWAKGQ